MTLTGKTREQVTAEKDATELEAKMTARRTRYVNELDPIRADIFRAEEAGDTEEVSRLKVLFAETDAKIREEIPLNLGKVHRLPGHVSSASTIHDGEERHRSVLDRGSSSQDF